MNRPTKIILLGALLGSLAGCRDDSLAPIVPPSDTTAPVAAILPLDEEQTSLQFQLAFTAEDDQSGVAAVEILVRTPDLVWTSLGRDTIRPVNDPQFLDPGDPGYPNQDNLADIMALARDDEAHAYKIGDISNREVVNDVLGGAHLAVTY